MAKNYKQLTAMKNFIKTFLICLTVGLLGFFIWTTHEYRSVVLEQQEVIIHQENEIDSLIDARTGLLGPVWKEDTNKLK